jgi:hypothetical protein
MKTIVSGKAIFIGSNMQKKKSNQQSINDIVIINI